MSSRLWLAVAFVLAAGASPARAETDMIAVTLDQAKIARLPQGTATLIVGNPMIADVTMLKNNNTMVITGKGFGQTNLIAIDGDGSLIEEQQIQVVPVENRAGPAERKLQDFIRLQSRLACRRSNSATTTRCSRTAGDTDLDPQRLRFRRGGNGREITRAAVQTRARCV